MVVVEEQQKGATAFGDAEPASSRLALAAGALAALAAGAFCFSFERPWTLRGDNKLGILPMVAEAFRQWSEGRLPAWTNGQWGGFALLADPQATAFYAPNLLAFALVPHPHFRALDLATALHCGVLVAGSVRLLGALGAGRVAALFGAALTLVAPQILWWTTFLTAFEALCWWPWLFLAAERLTRPERSALAGAVLGSLALGAQVLAGYAEYALYGGCIAGLWILCAASPLPGAERLRRALLLGGAACLLAAPQIVPTLGELAGTQRAQEPDHLTFLAIGAGGLASAFDPRSGAGPAWGSAFLGAATLLLAGVALVWRVPRSRLFALLAAGSALLALGDRTPAYGLVVQLPPFQLFRGPFKFFVATELAVIWLAALGLGALLAAGRGPRRWLAASLACVALAEYGLHAALQLPQLGRSHTAAEAPIPEAAEALRGVLPVLLATRAPAPPPRVLFAQGPGHYGSLPMLFGVEALNGGPVSSLGRGHARLIGDDPARLSRAELDRFGVELVLVPGPCATFGGRGLAVAVARPGLCVLRNPSAPPRYALVASSASPAELRPEGRVDVLSYAPGRVDLDVDARAPAMLLVRESLARGWRASVDGAAATIQPAAGLFFALRVDAGRHRVELRYAPPGLGLGLSGLAGWSLLAALAGLRAILPAMDATQP